MRTGAEPLLLSPACNSFWLACSRRFGVHNARIAAVSGISGPFTIGIRHQLMLVPTAMLPSLDDAALQTAMAHELAHMQRADFAKNLTYELLTLPLSWHPLLWATRGRIAETREMICDCRAAQAVGGELRYARSLLHLASHITGPAQAVVPHAIGIFDAHQLERRIDMLTLPSAQLRGMHRMALGSVSLMIALTASGSAVAMHLSVNDSAPASGTKVAGTVNDTERTMKVSAALMAANVIRKVPPVYPPEAKSSRVQGVVVLTAVIGKDGTIRQLNALSGPEVLRQSALDAVHQWTYKPYLLNGEPVAVETTITVTYSFDE